MGGELCLWCGEVLVFLRPCHIKSKKYCSRRCQGKWLQHKISKKEYFKKRKCLECNVCIGSKLHYSKFCSTLCANKNYDRRNKEKNYLNQRKRILRKRRDLKKSDDFVACEICKVLFKQVTTAHLKREHGIESSKIYKQRYPNSLLFSINARKRRVEVITRKNPTKRKKRPQYVKDAVSRAHKGVVTKGAWKKGDTAGEKNYRFNNWSSRLPYGEEWSPELKRKVKERDDNRCKRCSSKQDLVVHHRDEDKKNNKMENLITLCRSCHSTVHARGIFI